MTNHPPSVLWHCWLGHQTCNNRRPYNLYCVRADVKPCSISQSMRSNCIVTINHYKSVELAPLTSIWWSVLHVVPSKSCQWVQVYLCTCEIVCACMIVYWIGILSTDVCLHVLGAWWGAVLWPLLYIFAAGLPRLKERSSGYPHMLMSDSEACPHV